MKLEEQVCSLELAKKLEKLGVRENTLFYWVEDSRDKRKPFKAMSKTRASRIMSREATITPAFTVAELGEKLPKKTYSQRLKVPSGQHAWGCNNNEYDEYRTAYTEADARAKMLIYLLENNLLKPNGGN